MRRFGNNTDARQSNQIDLGWMLDFLKRMPAEQDLGDLGFEAADQIAKHPQSTNPSATLVNEPYGAPPAYIPVGATPSDTDYNALVRAHMQLRREFQQYTGYSGQDFDDLASVDQLEAFMSLMDGGDGGNMFLPLILLGNGNFLGNGRSRRSALI